jgi:peptidoglycan-associated lipoprotein
MQKTLMGPLAAALSMLLLVGCETVDSLSKEEGAATAENQGLSPAEMAAMEPQVEAGVEGEGFKGSALAGERGDRGARIIYFDYDSDEIRPEFRTAIEAHAAYLASHPDAVMTLEGHADERGSREYNLALGERRALAVRSQLSLLGGSSAQIRTVSFGEERAAAEGHDEGAYALNRRVEIVY